MLHWIYHDKKSCVTAKYFLKSLPNFVNKLAEVINRVRCGYGQDNKKCETNKYKDWTIKDNCK